MSPTKEQAAAWADELESGRWKQLRGRLWDSDTGRCCLGVLSEQLGTRNNNGDLVFPFPHPFRHWADGDFFVQLNDRLGYDFHQIAQIVRQRYQVGV